MQDTLTANLIHRVLATPARVVLHNSGCASLIKTIPGRPMWDHTGTVEDLVIASFESSPSLSLPRVPARGSGTSFYYHHIQTLVEYRMTNENSRPCLQLWRAGGGDALNLRVHVCHDHPANSTTSALVNSHPFTRCFILTMTKHISHLLSRGYILIQVPC